MSKHTPGPWVVKIHNDRFKVESSSVENHGNPTNGQNWICSCAIPRTGTPKMRMGVCTQTVSDLKTSEANANLIASAPYLLQICKMAWDRHCCPDPLPSEVYDALEKVLTQLGEIK